MKNNNNNNNNNKNNNNPSENERKKILGFLEKLDSPNLFEMIKDNPTYAVVILWIEGKRITNHFHEITAPNLRKDVFKRHTTYPNKILDTFFYCGLLDKVSLWEHSLEKGKKAKPNIYTIKDEKSFKKLVKVARETLKI